MSFSIPFHKEGRGVKGGWHIFHGQLQMAMEHKLESFSSFARCPIEDVRYAVLHLETHSITDRKCSRNCCGRG